MPSRLLSALLALLGVAGLSACGQSATRGREAGLIASPPVAGAEPHVAARELHAARWPLRHAFARARGRSLAAVMRSEHARVGGRLGLVTGTFVPGRRRVAFGVLDGAGALVYGSTAVYVADAPGTAARGPYLAPADSLRVPAAFRARDSGAQNGSALSAIYHAQVPLPRAGSYQVLTLTRIGKHTLAAFGRLVTASRSAIPDVGQRAPSVATPTAASTHGDISLLTTRQPAEHMHSVSFAKVLGHRPVALLFSTPAFCRSRLCGPVTDVAVYLQHVFGRRIDFIHSEIYRDNNPAGPVRAAVRAFHLRSEPWLFTIDRRGRIAARLEGAFGVTELRDAVEAALR